MEIKVKHLFFLLFLLLVPKIALATFNDISGTYTGTINFTDADVSPASCGTAGSFTGSLSITLIGNNLGNITGGNGQFINNSNAQTDTISSISGLNDDTSFSFSFTSDGDPGTLSGTFTDNSITITGGLVTSATCITSITSGLLTKGSSADSTDNTELTEAPSSSVTEALFFNIQIQSTVSGISNRIGAALAGIGVFFTPQFNTNQLQLDGMTGLNAGDETSIPYGVWGNYSYTDFENDLSTTAIEGNSHSFLGGVDFQFWENTILGVALGFDKSDVDTTFNSGNQESDTVTVAPYFGAILNDFLSVDFNLGYSNVSYDQFRTSGTTRINSSPNSSRWFSAVNLNGIHFVDRWIIGGRAGLLFASSKIDSYTESNSNIVTDSRTKVGTMSIGGNVAYSFNDWEPFLNLSYQYDYQLQEIVSATGPQPSNDKDDILLTTGIRYFEKSGITGNLEYSKRFFRDNFDEDRISLTVRIDY